MVKSNCPFEQSGCKFIHEQSDICKIGLKCRKRMCQYRHHMYDILCSNGEVDLKIPKKYNLFSQNFIISVVFWCMDGREYLCWSGGSGALELQLPCGVIGKTNGNSIYKNGLDMYRQLRKKRVLTTMVATEWGIMSVARFVWKTLRLFRQT